jgi:glycosyltransferase involved in cell wall biosynthesis
MLRDKGIQEFVDAASILRNEGVAARFVLVGDTDTGNPTSIPEDILHAWHSSGLVEWTGYQSDMPAVYARSHIVCLPSYREGLPTVLCEASSCGRPVVTTDVPGCREVVRDGVNGFIVPAKNATALACALRRLILDRTLRANMGKMARQIAVADFSTDTVIESTQRLYGEV